MPAVCASLEAPWITWGTNLEVCPLSSLHFNIILEFLATAEEKKTIKSIHIRKEETKLSLSADNVNLYIKIPKKPQENY